MSCLDPYVFFLIQRYLIQFIAISPLYFQILMQPEILIIFGKKKMNKHIIKAFQVFYK